MLGDAGAPGCGSRERRDPEVSPPGRRALPAGLPLLLLVLLRSCGRGPARGAPPRPAVGAGVAAQARLPPGDAEIVLVVVDHVRAARHVRRTGEHVHPVVHTPRGAQAGEEALWIAIGRQVPIVVRALLRQPLTLEQAAHEQVALHPPAERSAGAEEARVVAARVRASELEEAVAELAARGPERALPRVPAEVHARAQALQALVEVEARVGGVARRVRRVARRIGATVAVDAREQLAI